MIGETFGNFRVISRLGRGGMGEVYLAEQLNIGTRVAIKILQAEISEDKDHVQRFFNEARAVSRIQHAGIVKIFDVGYHTASGQAYLIMEYLEGESLGRRIRRSPLSVSQVADVGRQIASVLDATHAAGITHRDLKPDNIHLIPDREIGERVKILDFGIAKLTGTLAGASPRTVGTMGTPAYMAPEQWGDSSKVDWRADLYALGCVTFEMLAGRPPFDAKTFAEACAQHLTQAPPRVQSLVPETPDALDALIDRLLAKDPAARPASMHEVVEAFASLGREAPRSAPAKPRVAADPIADTMMTTSGQPAAPPRAELVHVSESDVPPPTARRPVTLLVIGGVIALATAGITAYILRKPKQRAAVVEIAPVANDAALVADAPIDAAVAVIVEASIDAAVASADDIAAAIEILKSNRDRLIACTKKTRDARINLSLDIGADGRVTNSLFTGHDPKIGPCLEIAAHAIEFPAGPPRSLQYVIEVKARKPQTPATAGADPIANEPTPAQIPAPAQPPPPDPAAMTRYTTRLIEEFKQRSGAFAMCQSVDKPVRSVMVRLTIDESGAVSRVNIPPDVPNQMQNCLRVRLFSLRFPAPPTTVTLNVPLLFPKRGD